MSGAWIGSWGVRADRISRGLKLKAVDDPVGTIRAVGSAVKSVRGKSGYQPQFSTRKRIEGLRERLAGEQSSRTREVILAQLAAFERPPRGSYD